ncbi:MAG TPA: alpha/beta fold hydrolase [Candidatus Eremiobacteraceae bacterium]|nr:alpha/beta fold hydrolase [Candidatus Eremiobacteraceae bacterium]
MMPLPPEELQYGLDVAGIDPAALGEAVRAVVADVMADPLRMSAWMSKVALNEQTLGVNMLRRFAGETPDAVARPAASDRRFADAGWQQNPILAGIAEAYLARARAALELVDFARVPAATARKARFAIGMLMDALAPSNVPWINPAAIKEAMNTGGASLVAGMENFLADVRDNGGRPRQVDRSQFEVGRNLARTPGRVVFRNELIELLAYEPQTSTVFSQPLLFSPPWINKYYIMDLAPGRSYVEWAVTHGFTVFCISYRNPDESMRAFTMDDYLRLGLLAALDRVEAITGTKTTNIAALCLGGTMAVILLGYLARHGQAHRIGWVTMTNSLVDFSEPGDLGVFTDEATIGRLEREMNARGYLESTEMSGTFDWLRGNDLVWNYVVTNWYMGRKPPAFDILAWNGDGTRMPAVMHSQYLRSCYLHNELVRPGAFKILDTPIDLAIVKTPLYVLGAETDHIAPWRAVYETTQLVGGPATFTLASSGHVAGIVNPPGNPKAEYRSGPAAKGMTADEWRESAVRGHGSWWEHWVKWASERSGKRIAPPTLPQGEPAPGGYVRGVVGEPVGVARRKPAARSTAPKLKVQASARNGKPVPKRRVPNKKA